MICKFICAYLATATVSAAGAGGGGAEVTDSHDFEIIHSNDEGYKYHYANYGLDWSTIEGLPEEENKCAIGDKQSPINLMQPIGSYGWAYGDVQPKAKD